MKQIDFETRTVPQVPVYIAQGDSQDVDSKRALKFVRINVAFILR
jgi:hypothetical protein